MNGVLEGGCDSVTLSEFMLSKAEVKGLNLMMGNSN